MPSTTFWAFRWNGTGSNFNLGWTLGRLDSTKATGPISYVFSDVIKFEPFCCFRPTHVRVSMVTKRESKTTTQQVVLHVPQWEGSIKNCLRTNTRFATSFLFLCEKLKRKQNITYSYDNIWEWCQRTTYYFQKENFKWGL